MMTMGVAHLDQDTMKFFRDRNPEDPSVIADSRIQEYAERTGGVTLKYWQLALGRIWGEPFMMSNDEVARRLELPESDIDEIFAETMTACGYGGGGSCSVSP